MKKIVMIITLVLSYCNVWSQSQVDTNTPSSNWSLSAGTILMSKYYGTIFGGTFYNGPMSFSDVTAVRNNRFGQFLFNVAIGQKLDRLDTYNEDGGNEYDIGLNQTFKFGNKKFPVLADFGVTYLAVYDLRELKDDFLVRLFV